MKSYLELLEKVRNKGISKDDRTGTGTFALFGEHWEFDMSTGYFPLLTTKKVHWQSIVTEVCWYLQGKTNINYLHKYGVTIWDEWADKDGELGPVYGYQWRHWGQRLKSTGIDQIEELLVNLKQNPNSRRHVVSAWNVEDLPKMALPPCHVLWQCQVVNSVLNIHVFCRSIDIFLGLPFDIGIYALIMEILCKQAVFKKGKLLFSITDLHLYRNHVPQADMQLNRDPYPLPVIQLNPEVPDLNSYKPSDFTLVGYESHPIIRARVAV